MESLGSLAKKPPPGGDGAGGAGEEDAEIGALTASASTAIAADIAAEIDTADQAKAATKIQARQRGKWARRKRKEEPEPAAAAAAAAAG
eukprot:SAG22_NODE_8569_length_644_cov_1.565138_1_plen_88_part_01